MKAFSALIKVKFAFTKNEYAYKKSRIPYQQS